MRFTIVLFAAVLFLALVVGILAILGPSGWLSFGYLFPTAVFTQILITTIRNEPNTDSPPSLKRPPKALMIVVSLINIAGGIVAFIAYWATKDHLSAARVLLVFASISLLVFQFSGGNIAQK